MGIYYSSKHIQLQTLDCRDYQSLKIKTMISLLFIWRGYRLYRILELECITTYYPYEFNGMNHPIPHCCNTKIYGLLIRLGDSVAIGHPELNKVI